MHADRVIENGRLVNVYTGEVMDSGVAVLGDTILHVGDCGRLVGPETAFFDAGGDYLVPGFFDAHAHMDLFYNPAAYARYVLTRGTTSLFNDGHDLAAAIGVDGFLRMFERLQEGVMTVLSGAPAATPPYPEVEGEDLWSTEDFEKAMDRDFIRSVSETVSYLRIVDGDPGLLERFRLARGKGKLIEGHTTGANWDRLNALAYRGVLSCHEALHAKDVLNRLRLGFHVMLRHGSIRQDMDRYMEALRAMEGFDTSRIMLVSDGIFADHLLEWGNMDWVVAEAVRCGLDPVRAIQMATLNPARYFRMDNKVGAIAPGRLAHILVVPSLEIPTPRAVFSRGVLAAEEGRLTIDGFPETAAETGSRPFAVGPLEESTFRIEQDGRSGTVPVITIVDRTVTGREDLEIPVKNGCYEPPGHVLQAFLISRDGTRVGKGLVKGFARGLGGLASTVSHDTHGLLVLGSDPADMAAAAKDALSRGGGVSLVQAGKVLARVPLPIAGVCSTRSVPDLAEEIRLLNQAVHAMGSGLDNPLWTLVFLSFTSVLQLRLTYAGVYDVRRGEIVF
ncbi:MAG: amidohydrolase family protein [Deltaproteobacteria bacterium]|nr:amidohydrolase family protein [Deltaproteobacteria bacterium]